MNLKYVLVLDGEEAYGQNLGTGEGAARCLPRE